MATPHDDLFHFVFQHVRHAAAWLRQVLPSAIARTVDWRRLRPAPEKLRGKALRLSVADLVFHAGRHPPRQPAWIVVEHKAGRDPDVEAQLLRYAVHLRDRPPATGAALPAAVVAVLLHHGESPFAPRPADGSDPVDELQPRLPIVVDDLRRATEAELRARATTPLGTLTLLCLRELRGRSAEESLATFDRWADLLRAADRDRGPPAGRDAIAAIGWYALHAVDVAPHDLHATFERLLQRPEETIMSTAEKLKREGKAEGLAEGLTKGRAETILRMLQKRFGALPEHVVTRVRAGSSADHDRWTDRLLDATSLAALFDD